MLRKVVTLQTCEISLLSMFLRISLNDILLAWVLLTTTMTEWQSPLHQSARLTSQLMYGHNDRHTPHILLIVPSVCLEPTRAF